MKKYDHSRRVFLSTSVLAATATAIATLHETSTSNSSTPDQVLKIGLIGAGARGTGAVIDAFAANPEFKLHAIGDVFPESIEAALLQLKPYDQRVDVPDSRQFHGLDAFEKVLASGVDAVILATPPGFRPLHLKAAVDAGKHIFAEKPLAVDMAGVKLVLESAKLAEKKGLIIQVDHCWRHAPSVQEAVQKLQSGEMGRLISSHSVYWHSIVRPIGDAKRPAGLSDVEWQLRHWYDFQWLSGGVYLEQTSHNIDRLLWLMQGKSPISARGNGSRSQRKGEGNTWDSYDVVYEFEDGSLHNVSGRQYENCFTEVKDSFFFEKGRFEGPIRCLFKDSKGDVTWLHRGKSESMYVLTQKAWFEAIQLKKPLYQPEELVRTIAVAIMGAEAAHTGQRITWDQLWQSSGDWAPDTLKISDTMPVISVSKLGQAFP